MLFNLKNLLQHLGIKKREVFFYVECASKNSEVRFDIMLQPNFHCRLYSFNDSWSITTALYRKEKYGNKEE